MCGILGVSVRGEVDRSSFHKALDGLRNRGPDHGAVKEFDSGSVMLGHRRLSIIDLSERANQPMPNEDKTLWLVFNGEIYNYLELRAELELMSHAFASRSDAEVILHAYEEWGPECLNRFRGIFAFAIYDSVKDTFFLARDHFGVKPLYYLHRKGEFAFASQPSAINQVLNRSPEIDDRVMRAYLLFGFVPGTDSIWSGVRKMPPGCYLQVAQGKEKITRYARTDGRFEDQSLDDKADEHLRDLVSEVLELNQRSDVPVAYLLSGGLDSSILCAIAQQRSSRPIDSFSVGFDHPGSDETVFAQQASELFGTRHHVARLDCDKAMKLIPSAIRSFDEPFNINGVIPYNFLCRTVREHGFKVAIGGDGADEVFGGYLWHEHWWDRRRLSKSALGKVKRGISGLFGGQAGRSDAEDYLELFLHTSGGVSHAQAHCHGLLSDAASHVQEALLRTSELADVDWQLIPLVFDQACFLPDHCLVKVDRSSMHFGLEVRVPFLDSALTDTVSRYNAKALVAGGRRKHLLKKAFEEELEGLDTRRKKGFSSPLSQWWDQGMSGPAREVFSNSLLAKENGLISALIAEGLEQRDVSTIVNILSLCLWEDHWMGDRQFADPEFFGASSPATVDRGARV